MTALFGHEDFAFFNDLRGRYYPLDHNHVQAHVTMLSHLPPSVADELKRRLNAETRGVPAPAARLAGVMDLNDGVALRIESHGLETIRDRIAQAFAPLLIPHDRAGWVPHVTLQNNVPRQVALAAKAELRASIVPRAVKIAGLASWWYRGGPWEAHSRHMFA
ncbi:2'-5' RNA ligase family protein [Sphingomonas sp.]|uniref:2'-5' RNA ligase family protein n=1 Tax=Sphingomonas sp. TaxID=28214 RepID=UPI0025DD5AB5|nr:2'-5' RNA ligase family protein [Sphingomonas sp.]